MNWFSQFVQYDLKTILYIFSRKESLKEILACDLETEKQWSGIMAFIPDELPLLQIDRNIIRFGGFSGHGNGFAAHMAYEISEYLKGNITEVKFGSF